MAEHDCSALSRFGPPEHERAGRKANLKTKVKSHDRGSHDGAAGQASVNVAASGNAPAPSDMTAPQRSFFQ